MIRSNVLISCSLVIFFTAEAFGISCQDKRTIVDGHNRIRRQVASGKLGGQPKASDMLKIVWDDKLATKAQNWANTMPSGHNPDRNNIGENLFTSWGSAPNDTPNWNSAISESDQSWFKEHTKYRYQPAASDPATGHYTQLVWANTIYIGCGYKAAKKNNQYYQYYVCNYGPAGNVRGQYPYKTGAGCENLCCKNQCGSTYGSQC